MTKRASNEDRDILNLLDLVRREPAPQPWAEGEKIPWDDPGFSERMLREHLSQDHDLASRCFELIDRHVAWIHDHLLEARPASVLDLGCGPGLYTSRLARLGHECHGIDFSPASIAYAVEEARRDGLRCSYDLADVREAGYGRAEGGGYRLATLIYGEFNVFRREHALRILRRAREALAGGGLLLIEAHTYDAVRAIGEAPPSWYATAASLFSPRPHVQLVEAFWDAERHVSTQCYYILDAESAEVTRHASSMQAYGDEQYAALLAEAGFALRETRDTLTGEADEESAFRVLVATRT